MIGWLSWSGQAFIRHPATGKQCNPVPPVQWLDGCPGQVRLLLDILLLVNHVNQYHLFMVGWLSWSGQAVIRHPATGKPCNPVPPVHGWMAVLVRSGFY